MNDKEPIPFDPNRKKKQSALVPLSYHQRISWLPSQLKYYAEGSQQNALRKARQNFGEKINIITIHGDPDTGA